VSPSGASEQRFPRAGTRSLGKSAHAFELRIEEAYEVLS